MFIALGFNESAKIGKKRKNTPRSEIILTFARQNKFLTMMNKRILIMTFFCLAFLSGFSQVKVYKGNSSYSSDVLCTLKDNKVYKGNSSYNNDILCHIDDNKVYKGTSSYSNDILYTIRDGKVYRGQSSYSSDIVLTIRDGKIYNGTSSYSSDIIANRRDNKIYKNTSSYSSDVEFTLSGDVTIEQFVAIWYAVKYCW